MIEQINNRVLVFVILEIVRGSRTVYVVLHVADEHCQIVHQDHLVVGVMTGIVRLVHSETGETHIALYEHYENHWLHSLVYFFLGAGGQSHGYLGVYRGKGEALQLDEISDDLIFGSLNFATDEREPLLYLDLV